MSVSSITIKKNNSIKFNSYKRPIDWLPLPSVGQTEQKFVGLFPVFNSTANHVALLAQGAYTVDWGDGSAPQNFSSNTKAQYNYNFDTISNSTLTSEGFKQVIITIIPQSGQNLTNINLHQVFGSLPSNRLKWLEIEFGSPNLTSISLGSYSSPTLDNGAYQLPFLRRVNFVSRSNSLVNFTGLFSGCSALESVSLPNNLGNVTSTSGMFAYCRSLVDVPWFNTSSVTNMSAMFTHAFSIKSLPFYNTSNVTNMYYFCFNARALANIPLFDTSKVTSLESAFFNTSITTLPNLNTNLCTVYGNSIYGAFESTPLISIPDSFFQGSITGGNFRRTFSFCNCLQTIPFFNTSSITDLGDLSGNGIFSSLVSLQKLPAYNFQNLTSLGNASFSQLRSLTESLVYNIKISHSYANTLLSNEKLDQVIENLGIPSSSQTLTITNSVGSVLAPSLSRSSTTTSGSTTITIADTSNFVAGRTQVTGTGISDARSVTFDATTDTVVLNNHGLANGKRVSFTSITTTTGISIFTPYFVVNASTNDFQLSLTQGGAAINLVNNGSGSMIYQTIVTAINPNVSVTVDVPASASGTVSLAYRNLNTQIAVMKRWTVTG